MALKVETKQLIEVFERFKMSNKQAISDVIIRFTDDGISMKAATITQLAMAELSIKKEFFEEFENYETLGITDFDEFVTLLKRFEKGAVTITKDGSLLKMSGSGKKVEFSLAEEDFITEPNIDLSQLELPVEFDVSMRILNDIFLDMKTKGNNEIGLTFKTEEGKLIIENKGKYKFTREYPSEDIKEKITAKFADIIIDALRCFKPDDTCKINLGDSKPIKITLNTELFDIVILVAPMVGDDEE